MNKISRILPKSAPRKLTPLFFLATAVLVAGGGWLSTQVRLPAVAQPVVAVSAKPVVNSSGAAEIALAKHLTSVGAKMYGAHWCPHCHSQKELFGKEAWSKVTYIECAENGPKANPRACNQAKVVAYPTWQFQDRRYEGATSLFRLARASKYQGPTNFKYTLRQ